MKGIPTLFKYRMTTYIVYEAFWTMFSEFEQFVATITVKKTGGQSSTLIPRVADYLFGTAVTVIASNTIPSTRLKRLVSERAAAAAMIVLRNIPDIEERYQLLKRMTLV